MFNGIIYKTGKIKEIKKNTKNMLISIESNFKFLQKELGSSVSCNGVCLTITKITGKRIYFFISNETLKKTNFIYIKKNQAINLEKSLKYGEAISGNYTQGHVDSIAKVKKIFFIGKSWIIRFEIKNKKLNNFLVEKASISINGVSLTISKVYKNFFEVTVIPHTLKLTNLKNLSDNDIVNVELDIFSKYIYKFSNWYAKQKIF